MKVSEYWINEFFKKTVAPINEIADQLTMLGLEVEGLQKRADNMHVVIGYVQAVKPHPNAKKLQVCQVVIDNSSSDALSIVCGANNVVEGIYVPVALVGAQLANGLTIEETELRGVTSQGMICSQQELGLEQDSQGILILPAQYNDVGSDFTQWAQLNDHIIDLSITPNRGDCLSMLGVARELSALYNQPIHHPNHIVEQIDQHSQTIPIDLQAEKACPRYLTCWLEGVNNQAQLPFWLIERLQRCDIRSVNPVVDILNYVMLELGQPMHAFDVETIKGALTVRYANDSESLLLLGDEQKQHLDSKTLLIADQQKPLAIAGVKGGNDSAVNDNTSAILLESAFFEPTVISGLARHYGFNTESAHRFERGVDYALPQQALRRAIGLIQYYLGGQAGPIHGAESEHYLPKSQPISLAKQDISWQLGLNINDKKVVDYLQSLSMQIEDGDDAWLVTPPSWRFDITIKNDLLEELARLYGYNHLSSQLPQLSPPKRQEPLKRGRLFQIQYLLKDLGYYQAINYSFIDPSHNVWFADYEPVVLSNPIASDMAEMRISLWPGLLMTVQHNLNRQQHHLRVFETGLCFYRDAQNQIVQKPMVAGVQVGSRMPEHWSMTQTPASDLYDIKGDVEQILEQKGILAQCYFQPAHHDLLHPGQTARIDCDDKTLGFIGRLHPKLAKQLDLNTSVYLFELDETLLHEMAQRAVYQPLSKYPSVRRDFAFVVDDSVLAADIDKCIRQVAGQWLVNINFFDMFKGDAIGLGKKSIAVAVTWQHPQRTFQDAEIQALCDDVMQKLSKELAAEIRN